MSARTCPECGGLVASTINTCPHCGHFMPTDGVGQNANIVGENPYTSIAWSIISIVLFWPFGIVSFIYYFKSDSAWQIGDKAMAERHGNDSVRFAKYSIWALVISIVFCISVPFSILAFV